MSISAYAMVSVGEVKAAAQRARQFAAPLLRVEAGFQAAVLAAHSAAIKVMTPVVQIGGTPDDAGHAVFQSLYPALVKLGRVWFPRALREGWAQGNARLTAAANRRKKSWVDTWDVDIKAPRKPKPDVTTIFDLEWPEIAQYIAERPITYAPIAAQTTVDMFRAALTAGVEDGLGIESIVRNILGQQLPGISRWRATTIARTECLPGETLVDSAVVRAIYRRWYVGPLVEIRTRAGRYFRATPNHPMLTRRGWVAAGALSESDDLICNSGQKHTCAPGDQYEHHGPATLSEIFRTLSAVSRPERVSGSCLDFHGDGMNGEVDILRPLRPLMVGVFSALSQPTVEGVFSSPDQARSSCCGECGHLLPVNQFVHRCTRAKGNSSFLEATSDSVAVGPQRLGDRVKSFVSKVTPRDFLHRQIRSVVPWVAAAPVECFAGVASVSALHAGTQQDIPNLIGAQSECFGDHGEGLPGCVVGYDASRYGLVHFLVASEPPSSGQGVRFGGGSRYTEALDQAENGRASLAVPKSVSNGFRAESRFVEVDRVLRVFRRESWSGHVFNLSTDDGYFSVDQAYTGNTLSAGNFANFANYRASGVVEKKRWLSTRDARTRESHRTETWRKGSDVVALDAAFVLPSKARLLFPGDDSLGAPLSELVNCRCSIAPEVSMPGVPDFVPEG